MITQDHVQHSTEESINEMIEADARLRVGGASIQSADEISHRIRELDEEWDIERWLEFNASSLALFGTVLGLFRHRKYLLIPGVVLPFLLNHSVNGWCPPIPLLRRLGIRTRREIDHEKYALKALRGDFSGITAATDPHFPSVAEQAWQAARP